MSNIVNTVLAERSAAELLLEQEALNTRAKVIAAVIADTNGKAPRGGEKLLLGAIEAGVISKEELLELSEAASELQELGIEAAEQRERTVAARKANEHFQKTKADVRQKLEEASRNFHSANRLAQQSESAKQDIERMRLKFPEFFEDGRPLIEAKQTA